MTELEPQFKAYLSFYTGSVTAAARERLAPFLEVGDHVVDATAGRGHDCVELAEAVGPEGAVVGVDIQAEAVASATERVSSLGLDQVHITQGCHSNWAALLPPAWKGTVKAFVYNLGYLPGGDHAVVTQAATTLQSVRDAVTWLKPGGVIRMIVYRGHPGGEEEYQAIKNGLSELLAGSGRVEEVVSSCKRTEAPVLLLILS